MKISGICKTISFTVMVLGAFCSIVIGFYIAFLEGGVSLWIGSFLIVAALAALLYAAGVIVDKLTEISKDIKELNLRAATLYINFLESSSPQNNVEKSDQNVLPASFDGLDKSRIIEDISKLENTTDLNNYITEVINHNSDLFNDEIIEELSKSLKIAKLYGDATGVESYRKKILDYLNQ